MQTLNKLIGTGKSNSIFSTSLIVLTLFATLFAVSCSEPVYYSVLFESNGGTTVPAQSVQEGKTVTKPTDPTREGYTFAGWYSDSTLTQAYDFSAPVKNNLVLYAKWSTPAPPPKTTHTVDFQSLGGSDVEDQEVEDGKCAVEPEDPTRRGYIFFGWYTEHPHQNQYDFSTPVTSDLTLYAKWVKKSKKTVSVTYLPGDGATGDPIVVNITPGAYTLKYNTPEGTSLKALGDDYTNYTKGTDSFLQWDIAGKNYYDGVEIEVDDDIVARATWLSNVGSMGSVDNKGMFSVKGSQNVTLPRVVSGDVNRKVVEVQADTNNPFSGSSLTLPPSVEEVPHNAFSNCSSLKTVTFTSPEPPKVYQNSFPTNLDKVYVPEGSGDEYKKQLPSDLTEKVEEKAVEVTLESISVSSYPTKTTYKVGDSISYSGLSVAAYYSDGSSKTVFGYTVSPSQGTTLSVKGAQTVTVSYTEGGVTKTTGFLINVIDLADYVMKNGSTWFSGFSAEPTQISKSSVSAIIFEEEYSGSTPAVKQVNLDTNNSGTIIGYAVTDSTDQTKYVIHIVGPYIYGNPDCAIMFGATTVSSFSSLKAIDFGNFDTSNVTNMSSMFSGCVNLPSITFISNFDTSKVTNMRDMFNRCSMLTSLDLSNFGTANVTTMCNMFHGCSSLTSITFGSNFKTSNVTDMGNMFGLCSKLESTVQTPLDFSSFNTTGVISMNSMFNGCSSLTSLNLGSFDTSKVTDMYSMFKGCSGLTSLDLSSFDITSTSQTTRTNVPLTNDMFASCGPVGTQLTVTVNISSPNTDERWNSVLSGFAKGTTVSGKTPYTRTRSN